MNLHLSGKRLVAWAFVLLATASAVNLIIGGREYFLLYASLAQLQFTVAKMTFQNPNTNQASILVQVHANNPVDYRGLTVTLVQASTYFESSNSFLFSQNRPLLQSFIISQSLPPHTVTVWNFTMTLNSQNATSLSSFYDAHQRSITAISSLEVTVSSFLTTLSGNPTYYPEQQNITLT